jgi:hypothetical protein
VIYVLYPVVYRRPADDTQEKVRMGWMLSSARRVGGECDGYMVGLLPSENQWDLLREFGLGSGFAGIWVEGDDPEELARRLRVDPGLRVECGFDEATRYEQSLDDEVIWIGPHAPGWTHILWLSGFHTTAEAKALSGQVRQDRNNVPDVSLWSFSTTNAAHGSGSMGIGRSWPTSHALFARTSFVFDRNNASDPSCTAVSGRV